jgi:tetratricopeptide (TPR) repeat protein
MTDQEARTDGQDGGKVPEAPLVAIGAVLLAAAIVGGAIEGAGVKVPVITGTGRQVAAGLLGLLMLAAGLASRWLPLARAGVGAVRGWSERRVARWFPHPDVGVAPKASEHFIGREAELRWIQRELSRSRRVVLSGLGGMGKSQLALQHLCRHRSRYRQGTFWLRGEEQAVFDGDLANLAEFLELPQRKQSDQDLVISGVVRWLAGHDRWLLVIDDLGTGVAELAERRLADLPGHVLITSRHPLKGSRQTLEGLTLDVATNFLLERTPNADAAVARTVANRLECLPLALEQASAYLEQTREALSMYAELLETNLAKLLAEGRVANHPESVVATWGLSFKRVQESSSGATDLLRLCAFLSAEAIPLTLLEQAFVGLPPEAALRTAIADRMSLNRTISVLLNYSLMSREDDRLTLHRLVQAVVRDSLTGPDRQLWAGSAVRMLVATFPTESDEPDNWVQCRELLPHALAAAEHAIQGGEELIESARLFDRAASYNQSRGEANLALPLLQRALAIQEKVLGPDHPDTARALIRLGLLLNGQSQAGLARPLLERALRVQEQKLGPEHPDTALALTGLALVVETQGDLATARSLNERALVIQERMEPDHPYTAQTLNNLATQLQAQGDLPAAKRLLERALDIRERVLGPDHADTAQSLNNLAILLMAQGDLAAARPLLERALGIRERVLGPEHPDTARLLNNLAILLQTQGDLATARPLLERASAIWERILGPDHPETATGLMNLAIQLQAEGNFAAARLLYERATAIQERVLGPDHPDTAQGLYNLASLLLKQGKFVDGRALLERALAIQEKVLGPEHPSTANSRASLISLHRTTE